MQWTSKNGCAAVRRETRGLLSLVGIDDECLVAARIDYERYWFAFVGCLRTICPDRSVSFAGVDTLDAVLVDCLLGCESPSMVVMCLRCKRAVMRNRTE